MATIHKYGRKLHNSSIQHNYRLLRKLFNTKFNSEIKTIHYKLLRYPIIVDIIVKYLVQVGSLYS